MGDLPFAFSPQLMDELLCGRLCVATMSLGMSKLALAIAVRWVQPLAGTCYTLSTCTCTCFSHDVCTNLDA